MNMGMKYADMRYISDGFLQLHKEKISDFEISGEKSKNNCADPVQPGPVWRRKKAASF